MQVAIDYYRMLMVPIQADEPEIERAYQERSVRPEEEAPQASLWARFSSEAAEARNKLLEESILVLLNPEHRRDYDNHLTAANPNLDVDDDLLPGALMILCETGDYQTAQTLAAELLEMGHPAGDDAVLTMALARLELGREAWKEGSYEGAAQWLQNALATLQEHQMLPDLQAETRADLGKLRPYRILQLVEQGSPQDHQQAVALLKGMLNDRQGIEGVGQDGSGLDTENFLRFVQRVRRHLTLEEQELFLAQEIERPSYVALYLAAQVQLAGGYARHQPARVKQAQVLLARLARDQDVGLEQAVCCLLLGQTQEALRHLKEAQDADALSFMQSHSEGSPDILPGLCRYAERWFAEEIFPDVAGLDPSAATLQGYFDDPQVQAYLEQLSQPPKVAPAAQPSAAVGRNGGIKMPTPAIAGSGRIPNPVPTQAPAAPVTASAGRSTELAPRDPRSSLRRSENTAPRISDLPSPEEDERSQDPRAFPPSMRPRMTSRGKRSPNGGGIPPLLKVLGLVGVVVISLLLIWRILGALFTATPPQVPTEQPQIDIQEPAVALDPPEPAEPTAPPTPAPPAIPAPWNGVQQVRVVTASGVRIRSTPSTAGTQVNLAPPQALLTVQEVQLGSGSTPIWLRVEGGWVAAELDGTRLVEPQ